MKTPAWQRKEGQAKAGGLNAKGRSSYNAETGGNLKAPVKSGDNPRRASFLARMGNMPGAEMKMESLPDFYFLLKHGAHRPRKTQRRKPKLSLRGTNEAIIRWS